MHTLIDELIDNWRVARHTGRTVTPEVLCRDCPELLEELRRRIAQIESRYIRVDPGHATECAEAPNTVVDEIHDTVDDGPEIEVRSVYQRLRPLPIGNLGTLLQAFDPGRQRDVLIKTVRSMSDGGGGTASDRTRVARERLRHEAGVSSRLEHPGIVPVYALGTTSAGDPFFVMRYIQGQTLDEAALVYHEKKVTLTRMERRLCFRDLMSRFVAVCKTTGYAHNRGVVHLDIKPKNIMLGKFGETVLIDWGLARTFGGSSGGETEFRRPEDPEGVMEVPYAGTPGFMSPEQASGDLRLGPASDIYSLGATLFYLLTSETAVGSQSMHREIVREKIRLGDIRKPRTIDATIPPTLDAICTKAMALNPGHRYKSAVELADDVERWLADLPTSARHESMSERLSRLTRRHATGVKTAIAALAVLLVVSCLFMIGIVKAANDATAARDLAIQRQGSLIQTVAESQAQSLAADFASCWRVLELGAESEALQKELVRINSLPVPSNEEYDAAQKWLERFASRNTGMDIRVESWLVNDKEGIQVARVRFEPTVGDSYRHRTYFHGGDSDLTKEVVARDKPHPIQQPHVSSVFASSVDGTLRICFSVPIWDRRIDETGRRVAGVLAMTVKVGDFRRQPSEESGVQLVVADLRNYSLEESQPSASGLVLNHPALPGELRVGGAVRLLPETIEEIAGVDPHDRKADLLDAYVDPKGDSGRPIVAAACPIVIEYNGNLLPTGLVAIAQDVEVR